MPILTLHQEQIQDPIDNHLTAGRFPILRFEQAHEALRKTLTMRNCQLNLTLDSSMKVTAFLTYIGKSGTSAIEWPIKEEDGSIWCESSFPHAHRLGDTAEFARLHSFRGDNLTENHCSAANEDVFVSYLQELPHFVQVVGEDHVILLCLSSHGTFHLAPDHGTEVAILSVCSKRENGPTT